MAGFRFNLVIGAAFGLIYVVVNAGALATPVGLLLRLMAIVAFVALLVVLRRAPSIPLDGAADTPRYGPGFWFVVTGEVVAAVAGVVVLKGPLGSPLAVLPWVSCVVGVHFFGLARVWGDPYLSWLGAAITACGALGLAAAAAGFGNVPIAAIAGVAPGVLLLAGGWWAALRNGLPAREPRQVD